jgi:glycosyltransferase involved in cell wall biosynthesis
VNSQAPTVYLDVTDLIHWVSQNSTVTGIQRVQMNYALHAIPLGVKFLMFYGRYCKEVALVDPALIEYMSDVLAGDQKLDRAKFYALCPNARIALLSDARSKYPSQPIKYLVYSAASTLRFQIMSLLWQRTMLAPDFQPGDILLNVGRSWTIGGYVANIRRLKQQHGIHAHLLLHDVIPIVPVAQHKLPGVNLRFTQFVIDSFNSFDRFFTSSNYNVQQIKRYMLEFTGCMHRIEKSLFGQDIYGGPLQEAVLPDSLEARQYLLSVGRVSESKNQIRLLRAWLRILKEGKSRGLKLVFVGKYRSKYRAFAEALSSLPPPSDQVLMLNETSDAQLHALYKGCRFTVFPSLIEGYGLPAAESISHGKFCLASNAASIPEAAGPHADFFDPEDENEIYNKLLSYIDNDALLQEKEAQIAASPPMSWAQATADLLAKVRQP